MAVWMILLGVALIGLCIALLAGMDELYFWGGIVAAIVIAFFYHHVVCRVFVKGYKSNLEKMLDLLKR